MIDDSAAVVSEAATVLSTAVPIGSFQWDVAENRCTWTDELYAMHGFQPGEIVPSRELVLAHKHPEDRERAERIIDAALHDGGRFSYYHRIIDTAQKVHHVLTIGVADVGADGTVVAIHGLAADLTHARRADLEPSIQDAIGGVMEHRAAIEQAKGILMVGYGVTEDAAFAVLVSTSQATNLKVHQVAGRLVTQLAGSEAGTVGPDVLDAALARITDP